ncbi:PD-(D/E)XK nuclease family transposase [Sphingobacterium alkalisoli]|nr:PD-(D/E)XK nuclease family transposase [Sphingobacterium alkalisoli]
MAKYANSTQEFYEGLGFIYMELINFVKGEAELESELDKVFFMLKNMSTLKKLPRILNSGVFQRFFQLASYAKLTKEERYMYDISLKRKWDAEAVRQAQEEDRQALLAKQQALEAQRQALEEKQRALEEAHVLNLTQAKKEALAEGLAEGERKRAIESARKMKNDGLPIEQIIRFTELSAEELRRTLRSKVEKL